MRCVCVCVPKHSARHGVPMCMSLQSHWTSENLHRCEECVCTWVPMCPEEHGKSMLMWCVCVCVCICPGSVWKSMPRLCACVCVCLCRCVHTHLVAAGGRRGGFILGRKVEGYFDKPYKLQMSSLAANVMMQQTS